jgi:O-antigen ligase
MTPDSTTRLAVGLFSAAAVVAPLCLGASGAWPRFGLEAVMAIGPILWAVSSRRPAVSLLLPLMLSGLVLLQLIPLPDRLLMALAPVSAGAWKIALQGSSDTMGTIAVDPAATAMGMRRLLLALATVTAVSSLAQSSVYRRWLVGSLAAAGVAVWLLGLVFHTTPDERIILGCVDLKGPIDYWLTPLEPSVRTCGVAERSDLVIGDHRYTLLDSRAGDGFGPYIYSNHFAGALCLTVPAIMGCAVALTRGRMPVWVQMGVAAAIGIAGVATSAELVRSRAGAASLLLGVLTFFSLATPKGWPRRAIATLTIGYAVLLTAFLLLFFGPLRGCEKLLPERAQSAVAAMLADPRVSETAVAMQMFRASPWLGTGFNSYGPLNAALHPGRFVSLYAHNDYAQFLAEAGIVGGLVLLAVVIAFGKRFVATLRRLDTPQSELAIACWAALTAIAIHSAFDWNLHLPANAFLACVAAGVAWSARSVAAGSPAARPRLLPTVAFATASICALAFLGRDALAEQVQRQLRTAITASRLHLNEPVRLSPAAQLAAAIAAGNNMRLWDSTNSRLETLLSQAHLHAAAAHADPEQRAAAINASDLSAIHARRSAAVSFGLPERRDAAGTRDASSR